MNKIFDDEGTSMSQWIIQYANELSYDAVGLWGIIPYFRLYFLLSGDALTNYTRLAIYEICNRGAKPVVGSGLFNPSPYHWILQEQYGYTKEEIADNIIKEWQKNNCKDPEANGIWFYIPDEYCFDPDYYQVNKDGLCLATWVKEFIEKQSKHCISLSKIITELQNHFDLSQYQLDYFVCMIIERLYYQGLRPVTKAVSPVSDQYQWILHIQYGLSASSAGFRIVKKWQENRKNSLQIEPIYFYIPDKNCFIPEDYIEEADGWKLIIF